MPRHIIRYVTPRGLTHLAGGGKLADLLDWARISVLHPVCVKTLFPSRCQSWRYLRRRPLLVASQDAPYLQLWVTANACKPLVSQFTSSLNQSASYRATII